MSIILVLAPHPDDETLGCGGTLLKHKENGDSIHWLIATSMKKASGFSAGSIRKRNLEIKKAAQLFRFDSVHQLGLPSTRLETLPIQSIVQAIGGVFKRIEPETIYLPHPADIHTDHQVLFGAAASCTKWFRYESIRRILAYETLSESEQGIDPSREAFRPNSFVDVTDFLERKLQILKVYSGELGAFPFPRSSEMVRALAAYRGAAAGYPAAEAFMLLKELR